MIRTYVVLSTTVLLGACGGVDAIKRPKHGVYTSVDLSQGKDSDVEKLQPDRFAYITKARTQGKPSLEYLSISPVWSDERTQILEGSFDEVPAGVYDLSTSLELLRTKVVTVKRQIGTTVRKFETRQVIELFPEPIGLGIQLEKGTIYEVALVGDAWTSLSLQLRKLNPDNFEFSPKYRYIADKRRARNFTPSDSDIADVVINLSLCSPCEGPSGVNPGFGAQ